MSRTFTIRSTFAGSRWWTIVIHDSLDDLREAAHQHRPWYGRAHWAETEGVCHPAGRGYDDGHVSYPRNGYCGIIRYAEPSLTAEIVAHELVHAAVHTLRTHTLRAHGIAGVRLGNGFAGANLREEQLAYLYGELYADLVPHLV